VLEQAARQAEAEGTTVDELANELLAPLLKLRTQSKSDDRWQSLLAYGKGQAEKLGIKESNVNPPRQRMARRTAWPVSASRNRRFEYQRECPAVPREASRIFEPSPKRPDRTGYLRRHPFGTFTRRVAPKQFSMS
jgi:hypothetical protein